MKCRDLLCSTGRELVNKICLLRVSPNNNKCYSVFIKMTYVGELADMLADAGTDETFLDTIELRLAALIEGFNDKASRFDVFIKRKSVSSVELVEYIVVHVIFAPSDKGNDIQNKIEYKLHKQTVSIHYFEIPFSFLTELVSYNVTVHETETVITVPNTDHKSTADILKMFYTKQLDNNKNNICSFEEVDSFKRIDLCLHIKTSFDEIPMTLENDFLYVPGNLTLSKWEYGIHGKDVLICLDNFEVLYEKLTSSVTENSRSINNEQAHPKQLLSLVCVCLSITCLLVTIAIYTAFSELHSQPGVNNIILSACLLLAQVFYQFGAGQI